MNNREILEVAELARLALTEKEATAFGPQLERILDHVRKLDALDLDGVPASRHAGLEQNVFREDEATPSLSPEDAVANAPDAVDDQFRVPRAIR